MPARRNPGKTDTGQSIIEAANVGWAVLVKAHGIFTIGTSANKATSFARYLEDATMKTPLTMCRGPVQEIPKEDIGHFYTWFRDNYGQRGATPDKARD